MKVLIVEDELLLVRQLERQLTSIVPDVEILGHTRSISETVEWLNTSPPPDLIFMDVELEDGRCFEIFQTHPTLVPVIFTTAHLEFALQAFDHNSIDYLIKPIQEPQLRLSLEKWGNQKNLFADDRRKQIDLLLQEIEISWNAAYRKRFLVKRGGQMQAIPIKDIAYFQSRNSISWLITNEKAEYVLDSPLNVVEQMLDPFLFKRINRQFLVAHSFIQSVEAVSHGKLLLIGRFFVDEGLIVSREKATEIKQWLGS